MQRDLIILLDILNIILGKNQIFSEKAGHPLQFLENDTDKDSLRLLAKDIFTYFGLGCRNVSKLFIPIGFDIKKK